MIYSFAGLFFGQILGSGAAFMMGESMEFNGKGRTTAIAFAFIGFGIGIGIDCVQFTKGNHILQTVF